MGKAPACNQGILDCSKGLPFEAQLQSLSVPAWNEKSAIQNVGQHHTPGFPILKMNSMPTIANLVPFQPDTMAITSSFPHSLCPGAQQLSASLKEPCHQPPSGTSDRTKTKSSCHSERDNQVQVQVQWASTMLNDTYQYDAQLLFWRTKSLGTSFCGTQAENCVLQGGHQEQGQRLCRESRKTHAATSSICGRSFSSSETPRDLASLSHSLLKDAKTACSKEATASTTASEALSRNLNSGQFATHCPAAPLAASFPPIALVNPKLLPSANLNLANEFVVARFGTKKGLQDRSSAAERRDVNGKGNFKRHGIKLVRRELKGKKNVVRQNGAGTGGTGFTKTRHHDSTTLSFAKRQPAHLQLCEKQPALQSYFAGAEKKQQIQSEQQQDEGSQHSNDRAGTDVVRTHTHFSDKRDVRDYSDEVAKHADRTNCIHYRSDKYVSLGAETHEARQQACTPAQGQFHKYEAQSSGKFHEDQDESEQNKLIRAAEFDMLQQLGGSLELYTLEGDDDEELCASESAMPVRNQVVAGDVGRKGMEIVVGEELDRPEKVKAQNNEHAQCQPSAQGGKLIVQKCKVSEEDKICTGNSWSHNIGSLAITGDIKISENENKQLEAAQLEAAQEEAAQVEAAQVEAGQLEAAQVEAAQVEAAQVEAAQVEAAQEEAAQVEAAQEEAAQVEAAQVEAGQVEAGQLEAAQVEAAQVEAAQVEAGQLEAAQVEAAQEEAAQLEAAQVEAVQLSTMRDMTETLTTCPTDLSLQEVHAGAGDGGMHSPINRKCVHVGLARLAAGIMEMFCNDVETKNGMCIHQDMAKVQDTALRGPDTGAAHTELSMRDILAVKRCEDDNVGNLNDCTSLTEARSSLETVIKEHLTPIKDNHECNVLMADARMEDEIATCISSKSFRRLYSNCKDGDIVTENTIIQKEKEAGKDVGAVEACVVMGQQDSNDEVAHRDIDDKAVEAERAEATRGQDETSTIKSVTLDNAGPQIVEADQYMLDGDSSESHGEELEPDNKRNQGEQACVQQEKSHSDKNAESGQKGVYVGKMEKEVCDEVKMLGCMPKSCILVGSSLVREADEREAVHKQAREGEDVSEELCTSDMPVLDRESTSQQLQDDERPGTSAENMGEANEKEESVSEVNERGRASMCEVNGKEGANICNSAQTCVETKISECEGRGEDAETTSESKHVTCGASASDKADFGCIKDCEHGHGDRDEQYAHNQGHVDNRANEGARNRESCTKCVEGRDDTTVHAETNDEDVIKQGCVTNHVSGVQRKRNCDTGYVGEPERRRSKRALQDETVAHILDDECESIALRTRHGQNVRTYNGTQGRNAKRQALGGGDRIRASVSTLRDRQAREKRARDRDPARDRKAPQKFARDENDAEMIKNHMRTVKVCKNLVRRQGGGAAKVLSSAVCVKQGKAGCDVHTVDDDNGCSEAIRMSERGVSESSEEGETSVKDASEIIKEVVSDSSEKSEEASDEREKIVNEPRENGDQGVNDLNEKRANTKDRIMSVKAARNTCAETATKSSAQLVHLGVCTSALHVHKYALGDKQAAHSCRDKVQHVHGTRDKLRSMSAALRKQRKQHFARSHQRHDSDRVRSLRVRNNSTLQSESAGTQQGMHWTTWGSTACEVCGVEDHDVRVCVQCGVRVHLSCYGRERGEFEQNLGGDDNFEDADLVEMFGEEIVNEFTCDVCALIPDVGDRPACALCPLKGGVMRRTIDGRWAHVLCFLFCPGSLYIDDNNLRRISGLDTISQLAWNLKCIFCKRRSGACVQCQEPGCTAAFHVGCAFTRTNARPALYPPCSSSKQVSDCLKGDVARWAWAEDGGGWGGDAAEQVGGDGEVGCKDEDEGQRNDRGKDDEDDDEDDDDESDDETEDDKCMKGTIQQQRERDSSVVAETRDCREGGMRMDVDQDGNTADQATMDRSYIERLKETDKDVTKQGSCNKAVRERDGGKTDHGNQVMDLGKMTQQSTQDNSGQARADSGLARATECSQQMWADDLEMDGAKKTQAKCTDKWRTKGQERQGKERVVSRRGRCVIRCHVHADEGGD